jgi:hypothetical protein
LAPHEIDNTRAFKSLAARNSYIAAHVLVRRVAAFATGAQAQDLVLGQHCDKCSGPHGRPFIADHPDLSISLFETFLAQVERETGQVCPSSSKRSSMSFSTAGSWPTGSAAPATGGAGYDFLIAYSCKGRGVCPSCNTRRMAETAAHLVDHVFPQVPVRQWVLSLPKRLRSTMSPRSSDSPAFTKSSRCGAPAVGSRCD